MMIRLSSWTFFGTMDRLADCHVFDLPHSVVVASLRGVRILGTEGRVTSKGPRDQKASKVESENRSVKLGAGFMFEYFHSYLGIFPF